ncbi:hypothetical protein [Patulibacter minatonensis]|uniref:hypothetical protein n=1 Tax=Patulibacter minatonensis TaxID=298163 RepID=UPI00047887E5|nr:hypothetical protein [Patulibacter minatonensis]
MTFTHQLRRIVPAAIAAGVLAGGIAAALDQDSPAAPRGGGAAGELPTERGPLRTALPGVGLPTSRTPALPIVYPKIRGTAARVVATVPDPYGGPRWAVRTFRRPDIRFLPGPRRVRRGTLDCAQVGRMLGGRFVWILPGARRAVDVPVGTTDNTVCTDLGRAGTVDVLRIPVGRAGASRPTVAATIVWGLTRHAGARAELRNATSVTPLPDVGGGARLVVRRGDVPLGGRTLRVDGRRVRGGIGALPLFEPVGRTRIANAPVASGLRIDAVVADRAGDRPRLLVSAARDGSRCIGLTGSLVGGEGVRVATRLGALLSSGVACTVPPRMATRGWSPVGGFAGSGGDSASADRRHTLERRALPGFSASIVAVPRDVVELDVQDGTGLRTVRTASLGDIRLAVSLGGGDLPLLPISAGFLTGQKRVLVGRDATGRTVRLPAARLAQP